MTTDTTPTTEPTTLAALLVTEDGEVRDVELEVRQGTTLASLYAHIGCQLVDVVGLGKGIDMWVDDEGLYSGCGPNRLTTLIAWALGHRSQVYVGNVVFATVTPEGSTAALTSAQREILHHTIDIIES